MASTSIGVSDTLDKRLQGCGVFSDWDTCISEVSILHTCTTIKCKMPLYLFVTWIRVKWLVQFIMFDTGMRWSKTDHKDGCFLLLHFLRFWNQICTWVSFSPRSSAILTRSLAERYLVIWYSDSSRLNCSLENTVRELLFRTLGFEPCILWLAPAPSIKAKSSS